MNRLLKFLGTITLTSLCATSAYTSQPRIQLADSTLKLIVDGRISRFSLKGPVHGYSIDCKMEYALAWGVPRDISNETAQIGFYALIDLRSKKIVAQNTLGRAVMEANYLADGKSVQIVAGYSVLLSLHNGKIRYLSVEEETTLKAESCANFPGKSFSKF